MNFETFLNLKGKHAPFSPSQPAWLNYNDNKLIESFKNKQAAIMGTRLHAWAEETINLGIRQPRSKKTLASYVNDAIGFRMNTEVTLYYSDRFFGTADAISFVDNYLRIHDLKTGKAPAHPEQVLIYAALFCLQYHKKPENIEMELRIYQNDDILTIIPNAEDIRGIMNIIVHFDKVLTKQEAL